MLSVELLQAEGSACRVLTTCVLTCLKSVWMVAVTLNPDSFSGQMTKNVLMGFRTHYSKMQCIGMLNS